MSNQIDRMVKHMVTMEFGDRGTWGCNQTELPCVLASLRDTEQREFLEKYLQQMALALDTFFNDKRMKLSKKKLDTALGKFQGHNPIFVGGFHLD